MSVDGNYTNTSLLYSFEEYEDRTACNGSFNGTWNTSDIWFGNDTGDDYGIVPIYPSGYSRLRIILTAFFVTCIMILIVVGNMLVCIAIATEKALKTVQNWFIASLAVSDFLVGLIVMPFSLANELMGYWIFGRIWCEIHSALDVLLCTASINSLCMISLDRYWSVTHAVQYLKKRTPKRAMTMICFVWLLSALISLPPLVGWKKPIKPSDFPSCALSDDIGYVLYSAFGSFYIPAVVMVFVYVRIFIAARSRARRHMKKKQQAPEMTNDPIKDKSTTTTTTCTSFSNPSPPDKLLSNKLKGNESNGTGKSRTFVPAQAPQIIIEASCESPSNHSMTDLNSPVMDTKLDHIGQSRMIASESLGSVKDTEINSISPDSNYSPKKDESSRLFTPQPPRKLSMLSAAPKFLKSPFGSTLSLADYGRSDEDMNELCETKNGKKKKKKKAKMKTHEDIPLRPTPTEAERQKRKIAKARERRATLILGLIMASFILAWLPFFVLYVLEAVCKVCSISETGFAVAFWLGYCNSALNPIIYTIFNRDFRRAFRKILFK